MRSIAGARLRLIAITLRSAVMTKQCQVCRRSASRQLHKEVALHPRNSSTTLMTKPREMKTQGFVFRVA